LPPDISWLGEGTSDKDVIFPMKFDYLKFHEIVNRKIIGEFYGGLGYHLDYYFKIEDEDYRAKTDSTPEYNTPHNYYSVNNNFSTREYILSGISVNLLYDTRDNQINPYKGIYANINYRINPTFLGSAQNSSTLWLEFRTYVGLSKKNTTPPCRVLAFRGFHHFRETALSDDALPG
jgi:outer membrane protein assembly factor BamA